MKNIKTKQEFHEANEKKGLWDNVHAKRKRGEKPAKKGDEDYPDEEAWKQAQESLEEGNNTQYSWGQINDALTSMGMSPRKIGDIRLFLTKRRYGK